MTARMSGRLYKWLMNHLPNIIFATLICPYWLKAVRRGENTIKNSRVQYSVKGKAIPLQASTGPKGSG